MKKVEVLKRRVLASLIVDYYYSEVIDGTEFTIEVLIPSGYYVAAYENKDLILDHKLRASGLDEAIKMFNILKKQYESNKDERKRGRRSKSTSTPKKNSRGGIKNG